MDINTQFIRSLLLQAGFPDDADLEILIDDTSRVFHDRMVTQIMKTLDEAQMTQFSTLIRKQKSDKEMYDFLQSCISNFDGFMENLYTEFEKLYLSKFKQYEK